MRSYGKMVFLGGLLTREEVDGYYDKCMELARGRGDREEIYNTSARYYRDRGDYERSTAYIFAADPLRRDRQKGGSRLHLHSAVAPV